jgi:hypothetical protein
METTLRPLTLGELLDRTAQLYRTNFLLFAGIAAAYAAVALIINLVSVLVLETYKTSRFATALSWQMQLLSWSSLIVMMIVSNVAGAANNRAVAWVHLGEPATIRAAYRSILPDLWRYLGLGTLKLLVAWSPVMVMYGVFQASFIHFVNKGVLPRPGEVPPPTATPNPESLIFGLITIGFGIVIWPVLIYAVFMALRYALALPASVVENLKLRAAIRRGISLSKGSRGRIFVLWMLVLVLETMALVLTQTFFVVYSLRHHYQLPVGLRIAQQIVAFITNSFVGPILAIGTTLFYYDQRVRKEGYDIEWMMAAAGLASAPPAQQSGAVEAVDAGVKRTASMPANGLVDGPELQSDLEGQSTGTDA